MAIENLQESKGTGRDQIPNPWICSQDTYLQSEMLRNALHGPADNLLSRRKALTGPIQFHIYQNNIVQSQPNAKCSIN